MRGQALAVGLAVLVVGSSIGCKTTSKMAWWKTSGNDAPEAEVLAHSAPALPSEIAKQVEGAAGAATEQIAGGVAAPFVPGIGTPAVARVTTTPGSYPSTEAPKFTPSSQIAAVPTAPSSANLGSVAMPYNPNAVPPAAVTTPVAVATNVDRYATTPTPSSDVATPEASYPSSAPGYGGQVATAPVAAPSTPVVAPTTGGDSRYATSAPIISGSQEIQSAAASYADRYAQATAAAVPAAGVVVDNTSVASVTPTTSTVEIVADASLYRPGGTSTYPATAGASVQVATRPAAPVENTQSTTTLPTAGDNSLLAPPAVPQVPRYR